MHRTGSATPCAFGRRASTGVPAQGGGAHCSGRRGECWESERGGNEDSRPCSRDIGTVNLIQRSKTVPPKDISADQAASFIILPGLTLKTLNCRRDAVKRKGRSDLSCRLVMECTTRSGGSSALPLPAVYSSRTVPAHGHSPRDYHPPVADPSIKFPACTLPNRPDP